MIYIDRMSASKKERALCVLWDWCILQLRTTKPSAYRQDVVRTLYRLASSETCVVELLKCSSMESDTQVQRTLSWACFQLLSHYDTKTCQRVMDVAQSHLFCLLEHPVLSARVFTCELIQRLANMGYISNTLLLTLDPYIVRLLEKSPTHHMDTVEVAMRYFLYRGHDLSVRPQVSWFLPCGGLAWKKALEYLAMFHKPHDDENDVSIVGLIAPFSSDYDMGQMVCMWSYEVQHFYVQQMSVASYTVHNLAGSSEFLHAVELLNYCRKAMDELPRTVPMILECLQGLDHTSSSDYRVRMWDACWRVLEKVSPKHLALHFKELQALIRRLPHLSFYWSKDRIRDIFLGIFHYAPSLFANMDYQEACMLEVLPDNMIRVYMDDIVAYLQHHSCSSTFLTTELDCLKFICRMNFVELKKHHAFVVKHTKILLECISSDQVNPRVRLASRQLLHKVPDALFDACIPALESLITNGDISTLLILYNVPCSRLRLLHKVILHRVLTLFDIYSDNRHPSPALALMSQLPDDVLTPIVERLVNPKFDHDQYSLLLYSNHLEERLFVLKNLPVNLLSPTHVQTLADLYLTHVERPSVSRMVMEIVTSTSDSRVCEKYKDWAMSLVKDDQVDMYVQYQAHKMLLYLHPSSLVPLLQQHGLRTMCVRRVCRLLDHVDNKSLSVFVPDIVYLCETYPDNPACVEVLARIPWHSLWEWKDRILSLYEASSSKPRGYRHILNIYSHAGVRLAREMLLEFGYQDILSN